MGKKFTNYYFYKIVVQGYPKQSGFLHSYRNAMVYLNLHRVNLLESPEKHPNSLIMNIKNGFCSEISENLAENQN